MPSINWHEWGKQAFDRAKREDKPVFLDISAVWCHWCHQMEKDTFSDPEVIDIINRDFIPIRVDTDKRPDINIRYNQGGWPTTAFITPKGKMMGGGTYFPPEELKTLMFRVSEVFKKQRLSIDTQQEVVRLDEKGQVENKIIDNIVDFLVINFDSDDGGFGIQPKFPFPVGLDLLLTRYYRTRDDRLLKMVSLTLEKMKGIEDKIEGGFFRYAVDQEWSTPHYEKLLESNAGIIKNYLHAYLLTRNIRFKEAALRTLKYVKNNLAGQAGALFSSQDAHEDYYKADLKARPKMEKPRIDRTVYTDSASQMASAYFSAYLILKNKIYLSAGVEALEFLDKNLRGGVMYHYSDGTKQIAGLLKDQVCMISALIDAFEINREEKFLDIATELSRNMIGVLWDNKEGGFFDKPENNDDIGELKRRIKPINENSLAAENFIRLHHITDNGTYLEIAKNTIVVFSKSYEKYEYFSAPYAIALDRLLSPVKIVVVGSGDKQTQDLLDASLIVYPSLRTVVFLHSEKDKQRIQKEAYYDMPAAYICVGNMCSRPVYNPGDIGKQVRSMAKPREPVM